MQPLSESQKYIRLRFVKLVIALTALILTFYLTNLYLRHNFYQNGEAYMKGPGHLLREDFWNGIFFLTARHFLVSISFFFLVFGIYGIEGSKRLFKILSYMALVIIVLIIGYLISQIENLAQGLVTKERVIEIAYTWILRVAGFFGAYRLSRTVLRKEHFS